MKGKIPLFLRLTLVVILAVSFSLVPVAVKPAPASADSLGTGLGDVLLTVGASGSNQAAAANYMATSSFVPTIIANVGDTITFRSTRGSAFLGDSVSLVQATLNNGTGVATGAPITLPTASTITVTTTTAGTFTISLPSGASGTVASGTGTVASTIVQLATTSTSVTLPTGATGTLTAVGATITGSPVALVAGANTIAVTAAGTATLAITNGPQQLIAGAAGVNTITTTTTGTFTVALTLVSTAGSGVRTVRTGETYPGGGLLSNGTGVATGAPIRVTGTPSTAQTVTTTTIGTFTLVVPGGYTGTLVVASGTATLTGSPVTITPSATAAVSTTLTTTVVGTITITPSATFGLVDGTGTAPAGDFNPGSVLSATLNGVAVTTIPASPSVGITTGANITDAGRGRHQFSFKIPELKRSTSGSPHVLKITDGSTERTANIVVNPKAVFTPDHAAKGATLTVSGTGFRSASAMDIEIRNATTPFTGGTTFLMVSQGLVASDANGSFSTTFVVPEVMATATNINVRDGGNATANAVQLSREDLRAFTIDPSGKITPSSGLPGSQATLDGSEFPASSTITSFTIGGISALASLSSTAVNTSGKVSAATFTVPLGLTPGKKSVALTATVLATGATFSAGFSFTASALPLKMSPTTGPLGKEVVITMSNMAASTTVGANLGITIAGILGTHNAFNTDTSGNATVTVTVPATVPTVGDQTVVVTVGATAASGTYTVVKPTIKLTPTEQFRGQTVTVSGTGWVADKTVTVGIGATGTLGATTLSANPGSDGAFSAQFAVPLDFGADSNNNISAADTVGNTIDIINLHVPSPAITVSPAVVGWNQPLTIKGKGFRGGVNMRYELPWGAIATAGTFPTATYSDSTGSFTATINVPTVSKGVKSIGITDGTSAATTTIEVVETPATVASALAPIAAQLVRVWGFDAASQTWKLYDPSVPAELNTLSALSKGSGYFINVKAATSIITGSGNTVSLSPGWQILGW